MTRSSQFLLFLGLSTAIACGGDDDGGGGGGNADSGPHADAALGADGSSTPDGAVSVCGDYSELDDPGNDLTAGGTAEATGITVTAGGGAKLLCGQRRARMLTLVPGIVAVLPSPGQRPSPDTQLRSVMSASSRQ